MSVRQINTANYDYAMMLEVINKSYKGKADITISEYDTTAAPSVQIGSVWEDNGAIFILETDDMTPTGYAGISSSTTFYLYYDESAEVFIYSETAPTWSDALQGWYNGNDRAFFSMGKDAGDTLYENKVRLVDSTTTPYNKYTADRWVFLVSAGGISDNVSFDKLKLYIPTINDQVVVRGSAGTVGTAMYMKRTSATIITFYNIDGATDTIIDGVGTFTTVGLSFNPSNLLSEIL